VPAWWPLKGLFLLLAFLGPASASAGVAIQVLETDPMSPAVLGHWESFYLRIGYETDRPIRVRGEALFEGKPVTSMTSGAPLHQAGTGDEMFWFAYTTPARVDRIRVWAEDERTRQRLAQSEISVDLTWTGQRTEAVRRPPEWVERFKAEQERRAKEDATAYMNRPTSWLEIGVFFAAVWSIPIYFVLQIVALWRFSGGWRTAAGVPAVPMALVLAHAIYAYYAGSNLFPLGLIFTCPPALIYLLVLLAMRRLRRQAG